MKEAEMSSLSKLPLALAFAAAAAAAGAIGSAATPLNAALFAERFTAFAVDLGVPSGGIDVPAPPGKRVPESGKAGPVEFVIDRYSTDEERDRLLKVLADQGPDKLLSTLQSLPRIGYFRTPNATAYDLKFARKVPGEDGGEVISMATDRYIGFWEARNRPRTIDYPFTVVEVRIGPEGTGEGKMSLATKVTYDKKNRTIVLENYKSQPVMLNKVKRETS
jgi:hypothetical protein